jgi:hypothetical protein
MQAHADHDHAAHEGHGHAIAQGRKSLHAHLKHEVHHYAHMLSEQGPMNITFVHNNTLLGLQHLHFEAAITEAHRVLGARGYEPISQFRAYHARGRINDKDLERSLNERTSLNLDGELARVGARVVTRRDVLFAALRHGADAVDVPSLRYAVDAGAALHQLHPDVSADTRAAMRASAALQLKAELARVGKDRLLSDWVGNLLGLDLRHRLVEAAHRALESAQDSGLESGGLLGHLGIPSSLHAAYLGRLASAIHLDLPTDGAQHRASQLAALNEERVLLDQLCARHWNCKGSLDALGQFFTANIETYACLRLWRACLRQLELDDPFSVTDPQSLQARDGGLDAAEGESAFSLAAAHSGGVLATPVRARLRVRIESLLDDAERRAVVLSANGAVRAPINAVREQLADGELDGPALATVFELIEGAAASDGEAIRSALQTADPNQRRIQHVAATLAQDVAALSKGRTHSDWLRDLTGVDHVETVNTYMIRVCAAFFDEGLAAWHMPGRAAGFFTAWRRLAEDDISFRLEGLDSWEDELTQLSAAPEDALIALLGKLGIPADDWGQYLGRMLSGLKGWAGMTYWYELHPRHYKQGAQPMDTLQYLAVRLFYEWMLVRQTCRDHWGLDGHVDSLRRYFENHQDEYLVRRELHAGRLPDGLADRARRELDGSASRRGHAERLRRIADAVWVHRLRAEPAEQVAKDGWRLYRLAQLLGLSGPEIEALSVAEVQDLLQTLDAFPDEQKSPIWLVAFERHYRDEVLNAIAQNHGRGRWAKGRTRRPRSQVVFCIDEREENLHRHYAELDPDHETLGAAGFFGVAQSFVALDDHDPTPLCPAVATPAHRILEIPRTEALHAEFPLHKRRFKWKEVFDGTYWETKRNLAGSFFLIELLGFLMAVPLIGRVFAPHAYGRVAGSVGKWVVPPVRTRLTHVRIEPEQIERMGLHPAGMPVGFQIPEATDRVEAQLRNWGLTYQFSRIVVICAHRSISVNNPHENAHDCGACGGKAGGPNSRLFAALANDPQVRQALRERGIDIPDDTWFIGAEHNTANDAILCFDTEDVPASLRADWQLVSADLEEARKRAARERCRRFGSAPKDVSIEASLKHVEARAQDLSQVRPEWGHCTNAFALVGRRCVTQGLFFDRRGFIISYDPTQDADGKILERILLAVGPVGAGINLEYYFSTVDPDNYGCGTKVPHNVTGMIGVMAGAHGDLQTGLPRQMTEVHEAMRLQLIVDAPMAILGEIYGRQPVIQQLLNNEWVLLTAHDPLTGELNQFVPGVGFRKWDEPLTPLPEVKESYDWIKGKHECFLPPARIAEPNARWTDKARAH